MKILYKNFLYEAVSYEQTPAFKSWFGESKVVDENGDPLNVYHGSTHDFDTFDLRKVYKDAYVGGGFYFTSSTVDATENYAGKGPDAENKIYALVDEITNMDNQDIAELLDIPEDEVDRAVEQDTINSVIEAYATKKIIGENPTPNIMPVYLRMINPYYIGTDFKQYFEYNIPFDEESEVEGEPTGEGAILVDKLTEELNDTDLRDPQKTLAKIMEDIEAYDGGFSSDAFFKALKSRDELLDAMVDGESIRAGGLFKKIILAAGFDGVIMDASVFSNMKGTQNTNHYIVYNPNQVKSVFNKNPTNDPNVTKE